MTAAYDLLADRCAQLDKENQRLLVLTADRDRILASLRYMQKDQEDTWKDIKAKVESALPGVKIEHESMEDMVNLLIKEINRFKTGHCCRKCGKDIAVCSDCGMVVTSCGCGTNAGDYFSED